MPIERVTTRRAIELHGEGVAYLDVRTVAEFAAGHPEGAFNIPLLHNGPRGMTPNPDFVAEVEATFAKDAALIVGCQAGRRSALAAERLAAAGYISIYDIMAGWGGAGDQPGWAKAGGPVSKAAPPGRGYADLRAKR
jgi:rhodanese-related sulfurtransferase